MSQVAFGTLKFTETLKQAGVSEQHAKAEAIAIQGAFSEALNTQVATKEDIHELRTELKTDIHRLERGQDELRAEQRLLKWMLGFNLIMTTGILWKLFIPAG